MMHNKKTHYQCLLITGLFIFSCLISSCDKQSQTHRTSLTPSKRISIEAQAHQTDIPMPIGCRLIEKKNTLYANTALDHSTFLHYTTPLPLFHTITFYSNEMERAGWDIINLSTDIEGMLMCSKPSKSCVISIRTISKKNNKTSVRVFIKHAHLKNN